MSRLKVAFPRMGIATIPLKGLLNELGFEALDPPPVTRETLSLGSRYTPEFACLPLKVTLGNYLQALPAGPDLVLMVGGVGPCRFGLYGEVQKEILEALGHQVDFMVIEPPKKNLAELAQDFTKRFGMGFWARLPGALYIFFKKAAALDEVEKTVLALSPRLAPKERRSLWRDREEFLQAVDQATTGRRVGRIVKETMERVASYPLAPATGYRDLKVRIVGELLVVLEPGINFHLERQLFMSGVAVKRTIWFTEWVLHNVVYNALGIDWQKEIREAAAPYLSRFVGGHGLETVANTIRAKEEGYNGVIQLAPLGCMPEVVAMSMIKRINAEEEIPVLSLLFDEHTAGAGISTRIEAFVDLIRAREEHRLEAATSVEEGFFDKRSCRRS